MWVKEEVMTKQEFIDSLYKIGWTNPNDAQWEGISLLYDVLCLSAKTGLLIEQVENEKRKLEDK